MKLWLSRSSDVPLHEQLVTQLILGIVSADLSPGERLPSSGQVARSFHIHPNTVRSAYRELVKRQWIEYKKGSGFYVRAIDPSSSNRGLTLDQIISGFLQTALASGYSMPQIKTGLKRWLSMRPPDHIVVIEPDPELREILMCEIANKISQKVEGLGLDECANPGRIAGAFCVALYDSAREVRALLPAEISCFFLHSRSIPKSLKDEPMPVPGSVVTVVSRWQDFLAWSQTTLSAIGIEVELKDARRKGWQRGLASRKLVVTDTLMASRFPRGIQPRVFSVISDESLLQLQEKLASLQNNEKLSQRR